MAFRPIQTSMAPEAIGPYCQAIEYNGLLFCSGQIPLDPESGEVVSGDIKVQTMRVLKNLSGILIAGGSGLDQVLKTTVYLTDLTQFAEMNDVYQRAFKNHKPARSTVQVAALPKGAQVEIDAISIVARALPT